MPKPVVRVAINGAGTIGKRVADAVSLQDDMKLVGVSDIVVDYRIKTLAKKGYAIYASIPSKMDEMKKGGVEVTGTLDELLKEVDIVIDCTPAGIGERNKPIYEKAGVKAIFEGGEKAGVAQVSFVAQCNYHEAYGKDFIRVVSCNTTGLCRVLGAIHKTHGLKRARAILIRRSADPWESKKGPINAIMPEVHIPSHQGPDAQTVLHDLEIITAACKVPTTLSHVHFIIAEPSSRLTRDDVINVLERTPRIMLFNAKDGFEGTQTVIEYMRDLGRPRYAMWELGIWEDSISIINDEIYLVAQVQQESIVVPENVDAIRAATMLESDASTSIRRTDATLGILKRPF
jgi:glyceraldehyde-3-phosphate dehydrogenase (NAD(P))